MPRIELKLISMERTVALPTTDWEMTISGRAWEDVDEVIDQAKERLKSALAVCFTGQEKEMANMLESHFEESLRKETEHSLGMAARQYAQATDKEASPRQIVKKSPD